MVSQYPHILKFEAVTAGDPYKDDNGDIIVPKGTKTTIELKCRFEPNSTGKTIISNNGQSKIYNWDIYMPLFQPDVPNGIEIKGFLLDGSLKASGTVLRFDRGQMNARAWV